MATLNSRPNRPQTVKRPSSSSIASNDENAVSVTVQDLLVTKNTSTITKLPGVTSQGVEPKRASSIKALNHQSSTTAVAAKAGVKRSAFGDMSNVVAKQPPLSSKENKSAKDLTITKPIAVTATKTIQAAAPLRPKVNPPTRLKITASKSNLSKIPTTYNKARSSGASKSVAAPAASTSGVAGAKGQKSKAAAVAVAAVTALAITQHKPNCHVITPVESIAVKHRRKLPAIEAVQPHEKPELEVNPEGSKSSAEQSTAKDGVREKDVEVVMELDSEDDKENGPAIPKAVDAPLGVIATDSGRPQEKQKVTVEATEEVNEADYEGFEEEMDHWDTTMVAEYSKEIFEYMRELEVKYKPDPNYMNHQEEIQWSMRSILVDWLVQVHARFRLLPETLFLCVHFIDRFLTIKTVSLQKLQLVGAAALFVAAKFEEIQCPSVREFVFMVDNGFTAEEILKAERYMLNQLKFELGWPGPMSFLRRCSRADRFDVPTRTLAKYLIEVTLMDERFLRWLPSQVAAAGHYLARLLLQKGEWTKAHVHFSGYAESELEPLVRILLQLLTAPKLHQAIYEKYSDKKFMKASSFVQQHLAKQQGQLAARAMGLPRAGR